MQSGLQFGCHEQCRLTNWCGDGVEETKGMAIWVHVN